MIRRIGHGSNPVMTSVDNSLCLPFPAACSCDELIQCVTNSVLKYHKVFEYL